MDGTACPNGPLGDAGAHGIRLDGSHGELGVVREQPHRWQAVPRSEIEQVAAFSD
jgi:hypothetical protein